MLGTTEGRFVIDHPRLAKQWSEPGSEDLGLSELIQIAIEAELSFAAGALQGSYELTAEDTAEHLDGKKEGVARGNPTGVIRSDTPGSKYTVDVRMKLQTLVPGVEHAEEANLSSKMPGIASDLQQGCGAGVKEQVVNQPLVLQG